MVRLYMTISWTLGWDSRLSRPLSGLWLLPIIILLVTGNYYTTIPNIVKHTVTHTYTCMKPPMFSFHYLGFGSHIGFSWTEARNWPVQALLVTKAIGLAVDQEQREKLIEVQGAYGVMKQGATVGWAICEDPPAIHLINWGLVATSQPLQTSYHTEFRHVNAQNMCTQQFGSSLEMTQVTSPLVI
jgi:hypothetical protein